MRFEFEMSFGQISNIAQVTSGTGTILLQGPILQTIFHSTNSDGNFSLYLIKSQCSEC